MHLRFFPLLIVCSSIMLVIKVADIIDGSKKFSDAFLIADLKAEPAKKEEAKKEESKGSESSEASKDNKDLPISKTRPEEFNCGKPQFSDIELDVLQSLAKRREELDNWEKQVSAKEAVLKASDLKVEKKIDELKNLKAEVDKLLQSYNEKEDMKISSLVKIYETMKPKDAAKIFEGLEMNILLQVIDKMKQSKVAPILAQMDPQKATAITTEYANQKRLPTP